MLKIKTYQLYVLVFAACLFSFSSCTVDEDANKMPVSHGSADFSTYVALGNSLTAGYANNALYDAGQKTSYPNLMAQQLKQVGGGEFTQPMTNSDIGIGSSGNARLVLSIVNGALSPVPVAPQGDMSIFTNSVASKGPFNNVGIPGAKVTTAVYPGYGNPANGQGNYNPFFTRILPPSGFATTSMLSYAAAQQPTFFTVFLGANDVLGYATSGGAGASITPMAGPPGVGFTASYTAIINTLTANGAQGAVANIPDVTTAPFFTTIPWNALVLTEQAQVDALNTAYAPLIAAGLVSEFQLGPNGFIIADATSPVGMRQMKAGELVLLTVPQSKLKNAGWGSQVPIPNQYILTASELQKIETATTQFNAKIKAIAQAKNLAYVDVNGLLHRLADEGIMVNGREVTADFVTGHVFSLDGVHLTPLGNALLANHFIRAINTQYNASIPLVDPSGYGGVDFPNP